MIADARIEAGPAPRATALRATRERERTRRRAHANERARTRVDPACVADPLARATPAPRKRIAAASWLLAAAAALHGALFAVATTVPHPEHLVEAAYGEPVHVLVAAPPHLDLPPPAAPPREVPPVEVPRRTRTVKRAVAAKVEPLPDPIDVAPPPTAEPPKQPPRRIVGLSLESTTTGDAAEAFALGNTRMGRTSALAEDPAQVAGLAHAVKPPRRTSVYTPAYPASLRGRHIRGEVGVRVEVGADGVVSRVSITRPSAYDEFNELAVDAARRCAYEPATVDGVAVAQAIEFTVQFQPQERSP